MEKADCAKESMEQGREGGGGCNLYTQNINDIKATVVNLDISDFCSRIECASKNKNKIWPSYVCCFGSDTCIINTIYICGTRICFSDSTNCKSDHWLLVKSN